LEFVRPHVHSRTAVPGTDIGDETRIAVEVTKNELWHGGVVPGVDAGRACLQPEVRLTQLVDDLFSRVPFP